MMDEQVWHIRKIEHYSSIKRNEALIQATAWMDLETIILCE